MKPSNKVNIVLLGFTYIELIIVMSIIGIMSGFFVNRYTGVQRSARDTQRKNDLKQYQTAIENYANIRGGLYPIHDTETIAFSLCNTDLSLGNTCAKDPKDGQTVCSSSTCRYYYQSDAGGASFVLSGALEHPLANKYWTVCSNGTTGESSTKTTIGACPI